MDIRTATTLRKNIIRTIRETEYPDDAADKIIGLVGEASWEPIETAPRDGRSMDLWVRFERSGWTRVPDAHWNDKIGNWQLGQHNASDYMTPPVITHWLPLPTPSSIALVDEAQSKAAGK